MSRCLISKEIVILSKRKMTTSHKPSVYIFPFSRTRHRVRLCRYPRPLFTTNASNSKSEKRKCGDLAERRSDRGRELRRAVTPFSFSALQDNSPSAKIKAELKRKIELSLLTALHFDLSSALQNNLLHNLVLNH